MPRFIEPDRMVGLYALCDPRDGRPRYVGVSVDPVRRYSVHVAPSERAKSNPKARWIAELAELGQRPILLPIDTVPAREADLLERHCIALLNQVGVPLLNQQAGGNRFAERHYATPYNSGQNA